MPPLLIIGLFTRPVAFILSGEMAFAYWLGHAPRGFNPSANGGHLAIMYCFVFLLFGVRWRWTMECRQCDSEQRVKLPV